MEAHVSTQYSNVNREANIFYQRLNVNRVVLERELSLDEIKKIKKIII